MIQQMAQHRRIKCRMMKPSVLTFIAAVLLLMVVSCQAETPPGVTAAQTPVDSPAANAGDELSNTDNQPSKSGLRARLEAPSSLDLGEPLTVRFFLANETENDLYILNWFTPLEGLGGDIFRVTRDGQRVSYQGPLASRGDPTPEAYTLIKAGGTASAEVDLSLAYDFSTPGNYTIAFVSPKLSHVAGSEEEMARSVDEVGPVDIPSNQIVVAIGN
jgi:hypothetical protein